MVDGDEQARFGGIGPFGPFDRGQVEAGGVDQKGLGEPGGDDGLLGVPMGMTVAEQPRPERSIDEPLQTAA